MVRILPASPVDLADKSQSKLHQTQEVGRAGLTFPAVFNAANEEAVEAFHDGKIGFLDIVDTVRATVESHDAPAELTLESLGEAETWARARAHEIIRSSESL